MNKIGIESFQKKITIQRILGSIEGSKSSPSVIVFAGIHGNEQSGIHALNKVLKTIKNQKIEFLGNFYAISGNLNALQKNIRFETVDLNRIWTQENITNLDTHSNGFNSEINEQIELNQIIKDILSKDKGPFYFIDLHTTSSPTIPFITISDSLNNRKFTSNFPVPIVLGIEEYLDGPLLTYINEFGHVALGFEGGQHFSKKSIINCEAFVWLSLVATKCIYKSQINYTQYENILSPQGNMQNFYEIDFRHFIADDEDFKMINGFNNFDTISKNQLLATSNSQEVRASMRGKIFMPLYQKQGRDGFFIITRISKFWLNASKVARKLKMHHFLRVLPGIYKNRSNSYTLIVNPKTAKFLATEVFHLFGYRKQAIKDNKLHFIKRDRKVSKYK